MSPVFSLKTATALMALMVLSLVPSAGTAQGLIGEEAPEFRLHDVDGNELTSRELRGTVVVLDFWAVWCGPCQLSLPFYQSLVEKYAEQGLVVVGLHVDDRMPPPDEIKWYLESRGVRYTNLISTRQVDDAYLVEAMPTTYILDRDGRIRDQHVGFNPQTTPSRIEESILELMGSGVDNE